MGEHLTRAKLSDFVLRHGGRHISITTWQNIMDELRTGALAHGVILTQACAATLSTAARLLLGHGGDAMAALKDVAGEALATELLRGLRPRAACQQAACGPGALCEPLTTEIQRSRGACEAALARVRAWQSFFWSHFECPGRQIRPPAVAASFSEQKRSAEDGGEVASMYTPALGGIFLYPAVRGCTATYTQHKLLMLYVTTKRSYINVMDPEWDATKRHETCESTAFPSRMPSLFFTTPGGLKPTTGAKTTGKIVGPRLVLPTLLSCMWSTPFAARTLSVLSLRGKQMPKKESNIMRRTLDFKKRPRLSAEQKARLDAVASMPDEQIDYSDAPSLPGAVWMKTATELPRIKQQITLRIDAEVLEFFKHAGKRYQSRINAVLRSYVEAHKGHIK